MALLTDVQCRKVKFTKPGTILRRMERERIGNKLSDGNGLTLLTTPAGTKLWQVRVRFLRRDPRTGIIRRFENTFSIGQYPTVPLASRDEDGLHICGAREIAQKIQTWVANGLDVAAIRARLRHDGTSPTSFESVAREWVDKQAKRRADGYRKLTLRRLEMYVFPVIGNRQISDITPADVLRALRPIEAQGTLETAHRVKSICSQVFRYAIANGLLAADPTRDLRGALSIPVERHYAAFTDPSEVAGYLRAIRSYQGSPATRIALLMGILTVVRPGNLRKAEWSEFHNLENLETAEWRIPGIKMKVKTVRDFVVPLARQVIELLDEIRPLTGLSRYLFPSGRSNERPMSNNTVNAALRRMGIGKDEMTGHGVRAMARTICHERLHYAPDVIEEQLAHAKSGPLGDAYDRTQHLPERRRLMRAWADWLDQLLLPREG